MIKIEHLAIWVRDLELMRSFYEKYFKCQSGPKYTNEKKGFTSYFLSFGESKTRLELMHQDSIDGSTVDRGLQEGLAHFALSLGSKKEVLRLTEKLRSDGYEVAGEPRTTGDGYFESVVLDPEGNQLELTI